MKKTKLTTTLAALSLVGALSFTQDTQQVQAEDFDQTIEEYNKKINEVDKEINAIENEMTETEAAISELNESMEKNEADIKELQAQLEESQARHQQLIEEIEQLEKEIAEREEDLANQARAVQTDGHPTNYIGFLLESESLTDALSRFEVVSTIVSANQDLVQEQVDAKELVDAKKQQTEETIAVQNASIDELEALTAQLEAQEYDKQVLVAELGLERANKKSDRETFSNEIAKAQERKEAHAKAMEEKRIAQEKAAREAEERRQAEAKAQAEAQAQAAAEEARQVASAQATTQNSQSASQPQAAPKAEVQTVSVAAAPAPAPAPESAPASSSQLARPANGPITSSFGNRVHPIFGDLRLHAGTDFGGGGSIYAAESGTVSQVGYNSASGNFITIDHNNGLSTTYRHLATGTITVHVGQSVSRGQSIATMGTTGNSTGVHLHFEVRQNGSLVNPVNFL